MGNPRPKKQRADYKGMAIEKLMQLLDERHERFSMNVTHQGSGSPEMVNWRHQDPQLQQWEQQGFHLRTGTYRDLRHALTAILERRDAFDEFQEELKKRVESVKRTRARQNLDRQHDLPVKVSVDKKKKDTRKEEYEKEQAGRAALKRAALMSIDHAEPLAIDEG